MLERIPDPSVDKRLIPGFLEERDNERRIRHYKTALRQAMNICLNSQQQEQFHLFYDKGMRKNEIAQRQRCSCSKITKSMKAGETALRKYISMYMHIFNSLEKDFLREHR